MRATALLVWSETMLRGAPLEVTKGLRVPLREASVISAGNAMTQASSLGGRSRAKNGLCCKDFRDVESCPAKLIDRVTTHEKSI